MERDFQGRLEAAKARSNINKNPKLPSEDEYNDKTISAQWAKSHAARVFDIVNQLASSDETAWGMRNQIGQKSKFIQPRDKVMDAVANEDWNVRKKGEITSIIYNHPRVGDIELAEISCEQLMCELIVSAYNEDSWNEIFFTVLSQATNVIAPWDGHEEYMVSLFHDEGIMHYYVVLSFSA